MFGSSFKFLAILSLASLSRSIAIEPYIHYESYGDDYGGYQRPNFYHTRPFAYHGLGAPNGYIYKHNYGDDGLLHQDGGYQGIEAYNNKKHHLNDDYANNNYYSGVQGIRKDLDNGQLFKKQEGFEQNGYNTVGDNQVQGHKKGHHRTGFKKSYHKDESGNDESYFDVDHDEGNREVGKKYGDQYETNLGSAQNGGHILNEFEAEKHGQDGFVGNGKALAQNQGLRDYYGKTNYYNTNGNRFGQNGLIDYQSKFGLPYRANPYY